MNEGILARLGEYMAADDSVKLEDALMQLLSASDLFEYDAGAINRMLFEEHPGARRCALIICSLHKVSIEEEFASQWVKSLSGEHLPENKLDLFETLLRAKIFASSPDFTAPELIEPYYISAETVLRCMNAAWTAGSSCAHVKLLKKTRLHNLMPGGKLAFFCGNQQELLSDFLHDTKVLTLLASSDQNEHVFLSVVRTIQSFSQEVETHRCMYNLDASEMVTVAKGQVLRSFGNYGDYALDKMSPHARQKIERIAEMYAEIAVRMEYSDDDVSFKELRPKIERVLYLQ